MKCRRLKGPWACQVVSPQVRIGAGLPEQVHRQFLKLAFSFPPTQQHFEVNLHKCVWYDFTHFIYFKILFIFGLGEAVAGKKKKLFL